MKEAEKKVIHAPTLKKDMDLARLRLEMIKSTLMNLNPKRG